MTTWSRDGQIKWWRGIFFLCHTKINSHKMFYANPQCHSHCSKKCPPQPSQISHLMVNGENDFLITSRPPLKKTKKHWWTANSHFPRNTWLCFAPKKWKHVFYLNLEKTKQKKAAESRRRKSCTTLACSYFHYNFQALELYSTGLPLWLLIGIYF